MSFSSYSTTITSAGTSSVILPYGANLLEATVWGAGGRGGKRTTSGYGGGGGGGGCRKMDLALKSDDASGATLTIIVGEGGTDKGINGGDSIIMYTPIGGSDVIVAWAYGGTGVADNTVTGASGSGGKVGNGYTGGNGASGSGYGGGGGGGAGDANNGTSASGKTGGAGGTAGGGAGGNGPISNGRGYVGTQAGGGGSGAISSSGTQDAGMGADGKVYISFNWPDNVPLMIMTDWGQAAVTTTTTYTFSELILNAGYGSQTDWVDSSSYGTANYGVADYWTGPGDDSELYIVQSSGGISNGPYQMIQVSVDGAKIWSNDFGITDGGDHIYDLSFYYISDYDATVTAWDSSNASEVEIGGTMSSAGSWTLFTLTGFVPNRDFNGLVFGTRGGGNSLKIDQVHCIATS